MSPSLAGQAARYIEIELRDFQAGRRTDPLMSPVAKTLSAQDVQALAEYFSSQRPMSSSYNGDSTKIAQGKTIAADSQCTMCHLGGFSRQSRIPVAAGQPVPIHRQATPGFPRRTTHQRRRHDEAYTEGASAMRRSTSWRSTSPT